MRLTPFEARVLGVLQVERSQSATEVSRVLYGPGAAYRWIGTVGRALDRLTRKRRARLHIAGYRACA